MKKHRFLVAFAILLGIGTGQVAQADPGAAAQTNRPPQRLLELPLSAALAIAVQHNLELGVTRLRIAQSRLDVDKAGAPFSLDPWIRLSGSRGPFSGDDWDAGLAVGLSKKFLTGTALSVSLGASALGGRAVSEGADPGWRSDISIGVSQPLLRGAGATSQGYALAGAELDLESARAALAEKAAAIVYSAETGYWAYVYTRRRLGLAELSRNLAAELLEQNRLRVELGLDPETSLIQARAELASRQEELLGAHSDAEAAAETLARLLCLEKATNRFDVIVPVTEPEVSRAPADEATLVARALAFSPDGAALNRRLSRNRLDLGYHADQALPDLNLEFGVSWRGRDASWPGTFPDLFERRELTVSAALQFSLPWTRGASETLEKTRLEGRALELEKENVRLLVTSEVRTALRTMETARARIVAADEAVELAQRNLALTAEKRTLALVPETDLVRAQRDYLEVLLRREKALHDHAVARGRLNYLCGAALSSNNIRIEVTP